MKKVSILLILITLIAEGCTHNSNKSTVAGANASDSSNITQPIVYDSMPETLVLNTDNTLFSSIRPDEKLQFGKLYTDTFEYFDCDYNQDDAFIDLIKDNIHYVMIAYDWYDQSGDGLRGDIYKVEWKTGTMRPASDETLLRVEYFVDKIKKIKDGKVSVFHTKYEHIPGYTYFDFERYTDKTLAWIHRRVEYCLANSKQEMIVSLINNPSTIFLYPIEEERIESNDYDSESNGAAVNQYVQRIYMDYYHTYEYDLANQKYIYNLITKIYEIRRDQSIIHPV